MTTTTGTLWLVITMDGGVVHRAPGYRAAARWVHARTGTHPHRLFPGIYEAKSQTAPTVYWLATPAAAKADGWPADEITAIRRYTITPTTHPNRVIVLDWLRRAPQLPTERRSTSWSYTDRAGGIWRVDYGYNGESWGLFGPGGVPEGRRLQRTIDQSLEEASRYIAKAIASVDAREATQ